MFQRKNLILIFLCIVLFIVSVAFSAFSSKQNQKLNTLTLSFNHFVDKQILKLDSANYQNELAQSFTISKFKYYISNIHFKNTIGKDYSLNNSFLIDEDEEASKQIALPNFPTGDYSSIDFILGVDSIHNCSGSQSGALDPINGMYWAWNSGYIFLKLEGKSNFSKSPGGIFEYHIGGYKSPSNCIRKITLALSKNNLTTKTSKLNINVNVLELFKTPTTINFEKLSSVTDFNNAATVANNYIDMFELIENEN